jgi:hypothetical protein
MDIERGIAGEQVDGSFRRPARLSDNLSVSFPLNWFALEEATT